MLYKAPVISTIFVENSIAFLAFNTAFKPQQDSDKKLFHANLRGRANFLAIIWSLENVL